MPPVIHFATGWHWAHDTGIVDRLAIDGTACAGFIADPADGGGRGAGFSGVNHYALKALALSDSFTLHFWGQRSSGQILGTATPLSLLTSTDEYLAVRGTNTLSLRFKGSDLGVIGNDWQSWGHYRIEVVQHASEGTVRAWNGTSLMLEETGMNTLDPHGVDRMRLASGGASPSRTGWFTHIILANENLGAAAQVGFDPAASDHAPLEWAKSDAGLDFFEHLNAVPTDPATYLRSPTSGVEEKTRHGFGLDLPGRRIVGARPVIVSHVEEEATDKVKVSLLSGSAAPVEEESPVDSTDPIVSDLDWTPEDPDTEEEWTDEGLAAAQVEVEHLGP
jgi:hypothetical protein